MLRAARFALAFAAGSALSFSCSGSSGISAAQSSAERLACKFGTGAMAAETLPSGSPTGAQIPLDHLVLMMQENRSFDSYYSQLTVPGQTLDVAADDASNPDANGTAVSRFHWSPSTAQQSTASGKDYLCFPDTDHSWGAAHAELDNGMLDGFIKANSDGANGNRTMGYYDEGDLPFYYALARSFAISDRHFSSMLGPTWPNRIFYFASTSYGLTDNSFPPLNAPDGSEYPNLFTELSAANVSWKVYAADLPTPAILPAVLGQYNDHFFPLATYFSDAAMGTLPAVAVVEGSDNAGGPAVDEHPPQDPQVGEAFVAQVLHALTQSSSWPRSAFFLSYDENGGEYDHVVPPAACAPDSLPARLGTGTDPNGFAQLGFRVPLLVVSPYARRGFVSHQITDHTSITRLVEARFGLPAMTARDANAWPLLDMFDFATPDLSLPTLPDATIEPTQEAQCLADFPPSGSAF